MSHDCEALFLGPHPDDVELFCGGTALRMLAAGMRITVVDMTRGEMGSRGDAATRSQECAAATAAMGLDPDARRNLELPDGRLVADDDTVAKVVAEVRRSRPRLLFAPDAHDIHPDHVTTALVAERAYFLAGLAKYAPELGAPYRPAGLLRFPGNDHVEPNLCIDISDFVEEKRKVVECYASQVHVTDGSHFAKKVDPLARAAARERYFGSLLGCAAAEPFVAPAPLLLRDLSGLFGS